MAFRDGLNRVLPTFFDLVFVCSVLIDVFAMNESSSISNCEQDPIPIVETRYRCGNCLTFCEIN
ncbi:hypothetical protein C491_13497 [Natronococcus amylolyticus DSM 10524]|uniref:Uncharacterized protein n=1 Tax=Natronococcus amylolyticus DSM 10524 TaxID=1227497 RepID=L9X2J1_9EURY|nr:hypothetical protein C491_13497 [Natronococcus amylolyticus DSM 10524]